jgi:hypothetical protein
MMPIGSRASSGPICRRELRPINRQGASYLRLSIDGFDPISNTAEPSSFEAGFSL